MIKPLINGVSYGWASIIVNILGTAVVGITAIEYDDEQDIDANYGQGNQQVSVGFGNIKTKGSITFHVDEIEKITQVAPGGRIQAIGFFDIQVSYSTGTNVVTHTLRNCRFKNNGRSAKQGDKLLETKVELFISHVEWKK